MTMAEQNKVRELMEKKFRDQKKLITFEDCKEYIETFHPEDKGWFFKIATELIDDPKDSSKKIVRPFFAVKKEVYERYFKDNGERARRLAMLASWEIEAE